MEKFMKEIEKVAKEKEKEFLKVWMDILITVNSKMIKEMEMGLYFFQVDMFIKSCLKMINTNEINSLIFLKGCFKEKVMFKIK